MNLGLLVGLLTTAAVGGDVWPGVPATAAPQTLLAGLPQNWNSEEDAAWRYELAGDSWAGPVIWKGNVYVIDSQPSAQSACRVIGLRLTDGHQLWADTLCLLKADEPVGEIAASTPVVDSAGVYAACSRGDLLALSHKGNRRWHYNILREIDPLPNPPPIISSLAQDEANLFVLVSHPARAFLLALDKQSGVIKWRAARPAGASHTAPILVDLSGIPQVVVSSTGSVDSYDVSTGKPLWHVGNLCGNEVGSPFVTGNKVLIGAGFQRSPEALLQSYRSNLALEVVRKSGDWHIDVAWNCDHQLASRASPMAAGDYAYWLDRHGRLTCFDLATGETHFSERLAEPADIPPLAVRDELYVFGRAGTTTRLKIGREYTLLGKNTLRTSRGQEAQGIQQRAIAAVDHHLVIRTPDSVLCIRGPTRP